MLGDGHVRFGGRTRETGRPKCRNRALVRPYTSIQVRVRCHPTIAANSRHPMLVEHEYERAGAWAYPAARDVHHAKFFGRCEPSTGIEPLGRLVEQVMTAEPYASARRVFWVLGSGSSHRGQAAVARPQEAYPRLAPVRGRPAALEVTFDRHLRPFQATVRRPDEGVQARLERPDWLFVEVKGSSVAFHFRQAPDPELALTRIDNALAAVSRELARRFETDEPGGTGREGGRPGRSADGSLPRPW